MWKGNLRLAYSEFVIYFLKYCIVQPITCITGSASVFSKGMVRVPMEKRVKGIKLRPRHVIINWGQLAIPPKYHGIKFCLLKFSVHVILHSFVK